MCEGAISAHFGVFRGICGILGVILVENVAFFQKTKKSAAIDVARDGGHGHCCFILQLLMVFIQKICTEN